MNECKNCGHSEAVHHNHFLCFEPGIECKCPGWVKLVDGVND